MIWGPRNTEKGFLFLAAGVSRHGGSGFAIFSPSGAHWRQNLNGKKVPTHRPICPLTCSTLVPLCSTHLGPPELLMAKKAHFWPFSGHFQPPPEPTDGNFWTEKWSQSTGPYVPSLVPPLFHFVPPIWGVQNPLMAYVPKYGHFCAVFGHKSALNGWNKVWSNWHTVYPTPPDQIQSLVLSN